MEIKLGSLRKNKAYYINNVSEYGSNATIIISNGKSVQDLLQTSILTRQYSTAHKLLYAIKGNKNFLEKFKADIKQNGLELLKIAIVNQDVKMINMLIDMTGKYSISDQNESVLELAVSSNNKGVIKALFENYLGDDKEAEAQNKVKAIIFALKEQKFDSAKALLEIGEDISASKYIGNLIVETTRAIGKELTEKKVISGIVSNEYPVDRLLYSAPKIKKGLENEIETLKFLSLLLNKGASIFSINDEGASLASILSRQDEKLKHLLDVHHSKNTSMHAGMHTYFQKLIFNIQNYFSKPGEGIYEKTYITSNLIKSILSPQQKMAYFCYKLENHVEINPHNYGQIVNVNKETAGDRWKKAEANVQSLTSKLLPPFTNDQILKDYIKNINDLKIDATLKCIEISLMGLAEEISGGDCVDLS